MKKKHPVFILLLMILPWLCSQSLTGTNRPVNRVAIMTYVVNFGQKQLTGSLIKSLRQFGGEYSKCPVYVVAPEGLALSCDSLNGEGVILMRVAVNEKVLAYPFAFKAFAAARVEETAGNNFDTLIWLDPGALVLGGLDDLNLKIQKSSAVLRTVSLNNGIGLTRNDTLNGYWEKIYKETGLRFGDVPFMKTIVDRVEARAYLNCQVYSIDPGLGVLRKWAQLLNQLILNDEYQDRTCSSFLRKVFLHQAVFSAVIMADVPSDLIQKMPLRSNYPVNHEQQMDPGIRIKRFNDLRVAVFDERWSRDPNWMEGLTIDEPLRQWLSDAYLDYLKLKDNLYRIEGSCVSYLIATREGSVMIDPAGASSSPGWFKKILAKYPLKVIIITHAHRDHWDNMGIWKTDPAIKIIAHRNFKDYIHYKDRLSGFFKRRNAIWRRQAIPADEVSKNMTPLEPNFFFTDNYSFEIGGFHFELTHTPGECPDTTSAWVPELGSVFVGDNYYEYFINNATFRGSTTRPMLGYITAMDMALQYHPDFFLMGHGRPLVGKETVNETVTRFRDTLKYLHDKTVEGMNQGKDVHTLMQEIELPDQLRIKPYYGKVAWTVRGIYHEYAGWFDEDPASMYALPLSSIYPDLVELSGGVDRITDKALEHINKNEYIKALHLTRIALTVDPDDTRANQVRLNTLKKIKSTTFNYIENIWLDYGIRQCQEALGK